MILSPDELVLTNGFINGELRMTGVDLRGMIEEPCEDMELEQAETNVFHTVIYAHTNVYTCTFSKIATQGSSSQVPKAGEKQVVQFADTNLERVVRQELKISATNQLYDVDVAGITNLDAESAGISDARGIEALTGLQTLKLGFNDLANLNVPGCVSLHNLTCWDNLITNLNISGCANLQALVCPHNQLTNLNLSACPNLLFLGASINDITNLDMSACPNLQTLWCDWNQLKDLDLSACTNLHDVECDNNGLTVLNISKNKALLVLWAGRNHITNLDVSPCPNLQALRCYGNQLKDLDLSACTNLDWLECDNNQLTVLDISSNKALWKVDATNNPLTNIVVWWTPPSISNKPATLELLYDGNPTFSNPKSSLLTLTNFPGILYDGIPDFGDTIEIKPGANIPP